jgi:hypothetical protein
MGHTVEAIIGSVFPGFGFGGRNSVLQQFLTSVFNYILSFPACRQAGVPGRQLPNTPTAKGFQRCELCKSAASSILNDNKKLVNHLDCFKQKQLNMR